ncbi:hypothetical protein GCM10017776_61380 [Streptomyces griseoluteus]|nr:hypothetical protein GCM10017776_61380 [Streptomyces griseoluteus]
MLRTWEIQIPSCACCACLCVVCHELRAHLARSSQAHPGECPWEDRAGVALSYLTPDVHWHTIWRTLANPGE